jgi:tetratricopeptide (TPR) repeat protein
VTRWFLPIGITTAIVLLVAAAARGEDKDRVVFRQPNGASIGVSGRIVEYNGRTIAIELATSGKQRSFDVDNVSTVEYTRSPNHEAGLESIQAKRWDEALRWLDLALSKELRRWVRREILALQVQCEMQLGHYGSAGAKFLTIVESDPDTFYYKHMPLLWTARELTADDIIRARQWMESTRAAARLLGASFLINDPQQGDSAAQVLRKLSSHPDSRIMGLARGQSWRMKLRKGQVTANDLRTWTTQIETMPEGLRAGPYFLLGRGYLASEQPARAAQAFLWVPLVYDHDPLLAARACLEAAHALISAGQSQQAQTLLREVATRYADTPFAGEARAAIKDAKP